MCLAWPLRAGVGVRPWQPPSSLMTDVAPKAEALAVEESIVESQFSSDSRTYL